MSDTAGEAQVDDDTDEKLREILCVCPSRALWQDSVEVIHAIRTHSYIHHSTGSQPRRSFQTDANMENVQFRLLQVSLFKDHCGLFSQLQGGGGLYLKGFAN